MEKTTMYRTADGENFESKAEALAHQRELDLEALGFDLDLLKENVDAIYSFLKPFRTIKPRAKKSE